MAKTAKRTKPDPKDTFESAARRLECDEDKGQFEKKLGKIAKTKVANNPK
jgi:hypothetical protein